MTPGQKDILPRFTIILFLMALMAVAVIVKAAFIMFAERGYWEEVADRFVKETWWFIRTGETSSPPTEN